MNFLYCAIGLFVIGIIYFMFDMNKRITELEKATIEWRKKNINSSFEEYRKGKDKK